MLLCNDAVVSGWAIMLHYAHTLCSHLAAYNYIDSRITSPPQTVSACVDYIHVYIKDLCIKYMHSHTSCSFSLLAIPFTEIAVALSIKYTVSQKQKHKVTSCQSANVQQLPCFAVLLNLAPTTLLTLAFLITLVLQSISCFIVVMSMQCI